MFSVKYHLSRRYNEIYVFGRFDVVSHLYQRCMEDLYNRHIPYLLLTDNDYNKQIIAKVRRNIEKRNHSNAQNK